MRYYRGAQARILHPAAQRQGCIISRTGYTGEDGFELSLGASIAQGVWEVLMELGQPLGVVPAGLGARDTLRLEAGMPLYGHELSEADQSFPGRPGLRLPPGGLQLSRPRRPAADPKSAAASRSASGWKWRASAPPGKAAPSSSTASRSAKSPAEAIRPRSAGRLPWAMRSNTSQRKGKGNIKKNRRFISEFGRRGAGPGEFNFPTHINVDAAGRVYVTDSLNCRIQVFDASGQFQRAFGSAGDGAGPL